MNVLTTLLVAAGIVLIVLSPIFIGLALAACKVDGFHGDKRRDMPAAAPVTPVERPAPATVPRGPIRVASERVTQVEAA